MSRRGKPQPSYASPGSHHAQRPERVSCGRTRLRGSVSGCTGTVGRGSATRVRCTRSTDRVRAGSFSAARREEATTALISSTKQQRWRAVVRRSGRQAGGLSRVLAVVFRAIRVRRIGSLVDSARAEGGDGSALGPAEHRSIEEGKAR